MKTLETKSLVLLRHHLKALRLPTIGAEAEKVAVQAAADNQDHLSYLLQLCELELLEREKRAAERRLKAARFPTMKTLEGFDFAARPSVNKRLVAELARCEYIDQRENVLLVGNPGTGKSHLATALAAEACARGYKVRFYRATELVTTLIEARDERSFLRLKAQLAKLDLLVLDELGYVPASKVGAELLFDVISTAYERSSRPRAPATASTTPRPAAAEGRTPTRRSPRRPAATRPISPMDESRHTPAGRQNGSYGLEVRDHPRLRGHTGGTPPQLLSGSQGRLPAPSSHRTVLALFAHGSSGRRVVTPAVGRFATSIHPHSSVSCCGVGATISWWVRRCNATSDTSPRSAKYRLRRP